jgi:hypothetical protein
MGLDETLAELRLILRVGHAQIGSPEPDASSQVLAAVDAYNAAARLRGLENELNPLVLEPAKVAAFLAWLPTIDAPTREQLAGKTILLNDTNLGLHEASATALIAAGAKASFYEASPVQNYAPLRIETALAEDAADRVEHAREAVIAFDEQVAAREQAAASATAPAERSTALQELNLAKQKRYAAASVWERNAKLLAQQSPTSHALQSDAAAAVQASARYLVPPWLGLPTPPQTARSVSEGNR